MHTLTLFLLFLLTVGGNHEASNYLWELYYGGYVAPKMFFMGYSGVVNFGGLRIGGLSGIFDKRNYRYVSAFHVGSNRIPI